MKRRAIFLLWFCACEGPATYEARIAHAGGLAEGSPVEVAGVRVGSVSSVRVAGGVAVVRFGVDREHQLALQSDACASVRASAAPTLVVAVGQDPTPLQHAIAECPRADDLVEAGRQLGETVRSVAEGFLGELNQLAPPAAPNPQPSVAPPAPAP